MCSLHQDHLQGWVWGTLTAIALERIVDRSVDKLTAEHWAVHTIKEGRF